MQRTACTEEDESKRSQGEIFPKRKARVLHGGKIFHGNLQRNSEIAVSHCRDATTVTGSRANPATANRPSTSRSHACGP